MNAKNYMPSICFVMGVSGSGKSTIGKMLSEKIRFPFFDADDYHSQANKEKMKAGIPLTDEDRAGWLLHLNQLARQESLHGAVIACSALKEKYRVILAEKIPMPVHWIFLKGDYRLIHQRLLERAGHFMPPGLLESQFDTLEPPENALQFDIANNPAEIVDMIVAAI